MHHLTRYLGVCVLASLVAACSGQHSTSLIPATNGPSNADQPATNLNTTAASSTATSSLPNSSAFGFRGPIVGLRTGGGLTLRGDASQGYVPVTATSATVTNADGGSATAGHYALVVGSGSTGAGITAQYIATFTGEPSTVTLTGTYVGAKTYGFEIKTTSSGTVPILVSSSAKLTGSSRPAARCR